MKKLLLTAAIAVIGATSAQAADLPARTYTKAPMVAPVMNWTGFFIGAEGGYGWGRDTIAFPGPVTTTGRFDTSGGVAGGVVGYNWQPIGSNWVFGVEGNFDWADIKGSAVCPAVAFTCRTTINSIYSGTARAGYAWNSVLAYVKGGYAWSNQRYVGFNTATGAIFDSAKYTMDGWTVGGGLEYMFLPNWSAKVEYNYYDFGNKNINAFTPANAFQEVINVSPRVSVIKAGINYHFNWK